MGAGRHTKSQAWCPRPDGPHRSRAVASLAGALALLALFACGDAREARQVPPQRIYLITIDTLRADRLGWHGYPRGTSPFLDGLAERSLVFMRAFSSISHTAPSHASMFTGLQPAQHRLLQNGQRLSASFTTTAQSLRAAGYRTAAFTPVGFLDGLAAGFEEFDSAPALEAAPRVLSRARAWIESREPHERVFVWVHLFDVHQWYEAGSVDATARETIAASPVSGDALIAFLEREQGIPRDALPGTYLHDMDAYDAQVLSVDRALGAFHAALERGDRNANALWIVTSDHGEGLGNHGHRGHGRFVYREQIHVPLVLHWSDGRQPARRIDSPVRLVDLTPTLTALVGAPFEQAIPIVGRSLVPLFDGIDENGPPPVFSQRRPADARRREAGWEAGAIYALQDANRKLIAHANGEHELFDLRKDPFELHSQFDPDSPDQRRLLNELLGRYRLLRQQGRHIRSGDVPAETVEQLRALGYL